MTKRQDPKGKKKAPSTKRKSKGVISETTQGVAVQRSAGRPSVFSIEVANVILDRMSKGESLNAICKEEGMPAESTVRAWALDDVGGIAAKYARARELQAEFWADEIIKLADDSRTGITPKEAQMGVEVTTGDMVERSRIQIEARKWLLSKLLPKKYGDKLEVDNNMNVTVKHKWGS